jgi:hypothetical protein
VNRESNVALLQRDFPAFASCVGAGIQALGEGECEVNLLPQEKQEALEFKKKQKLVILAMASLFLIPGWLFMSFNSKIRNAQSALESTDVVKELDSRAKEIRVLEEEKRPALEAAGKSLIDPVALRLEAFDAWQMIQTVFAEIPNSDVVPEETFDQNTVAAGKGQLTAAQEELNAGKWWLSLVEIRRGYRKADGTVLEKPDKNEVTVPVYEVQLTGVRYKVGTEITNTNAVRGRIQGYVEQKLRERYGADLPGELATVALSPVEPTSLFTAHPAHPLHPAEDDRSFAHRVHLQVGRLIP